MEAKRMPHTLRENELLLATSSSRNGIFSREAIYFMLTHSLMNILRPLVFTVEEAEKEAPYNIICMFSFHVLGSSNLRIKYLNIQYTKKKQNKRFK